MGEIKSPNRVEIERLILNSFPKCPFCGMDDMKFEWGSLVPKRMTCQHCGASWWPLLSHGETWEFLSAQLVSIDSQGKGVKLLNKFYPRDFWERMTGAASEKQVNHRESAHALLSQASSVGTTKTVIIREVVKIRCPYCGGLYDEVRDRCPYCGGKR